MPYLTHNQPINYRIQQIQIVSVNDLTLKAKARTKDLRFQSLFQRKWPIWMRLKRTIYNFVIATVLQATKVFCIVLKITAMSRAFSLTPPTNCCISSWLKRIGHSRSNWSHYQSTVRKHSFDRCCCERIASDMWKRVKPASWKQGRLIVIEYPLNRYRGRIVYLTIGSLIVLDHSLLPKVRRSNTIMLSLL